jgi:hypothetical protein
MAKVVTAQPAEDKLDRTVLPLRSCRTHLSRSLTPATPRSRRGLRSKAPQGAPNVALLKAEEYSNEELGWILDCSVMTV